MLQSFPFGWEDATEGFRGHVFMSSDNSTVILSIKGTTLQGPTSKKDKFNDNLFVVQYLIDVLVLNDITDTAAYSPVVVPVSTFRGSSVLYATATPATGAAMTPASPMRSSRTASSTQLAL